ncbi:MAG: hypothetical protein ACK4UN_02710, partial [Limisphaerales bacterium]
MALVVGSLRNSSHTAGPSISGIIQSNTMASGTDPVTRRFHLEPFSEQMKLHQLNNIPFVVGDQNSGNHISEI